MSKIDVKATLTELEKLRDELIPQGQYNTEMRVALLQSLISAYELGHKDARQAFDEILKASRKEMKVDEPTRIN